MKYLVANSSPEFRSIIKHFWSLEQSADEVLDSREPVLPDGCPEIVFNLSDRFRRYTNETEFELQPQTIIAGQMTQRVVIGPSGDVNLFGIRFQPFGAYYFLRVPMIDLSNRIDGMELLMSKTESILREQLLECDSFAARISVFEGVLAERLKRAELPDRKLSCVVDSLARRSNVRVGRFASEIGWTERKLERDFKKYVGLSPKMFGRVSRFSAIVRALETNGPTRLVEPAHDFGYYDQSHMINEFREFSGESPTSFYDRSHRLSELFTVGE